MQTLIDVGRKFLEAPGPTAQEWQDMEKPVGMESRVNEVWGYFEDNSVRLICLYGVRGVRKTAILNSLNSKFSDSINNFDPVILVKASCGVINIEKIQPVIRYKLKISDEIWNSKDKQGRVDEISQRLSREGLRCCWMTSEDQ